MTTWTNTCIKNCHRIATTIEITDDGTFAFAGHRVGNVLSCHLTIAKGAEAVLARLVTDLEKREFLDIVLLTRLMREMIYGGPVIDNINLPCTHNVLVDDVCVNCGMSLTEIKEIQS